MNDQSIRQATGRTGEQWFEAIRQAGKAAASHKEIAAYLHETQGVSPWWAQEITVEYERRTGRRTTGQTQDGFFQVGVSRTIDAPPERVWGCLESAWGIGLIAGQGTKGELAELPAGEGTASERALLPPGPYSLASLDVETSAGTRVSTTTFEAGSHVRMRWQRPQWAGHSILQIRVIPKTGAKTLLSFHQEKLPSPAVREQMRVRWRQVAAALAAACARVT